MLKEILSRTELIERLNAPEHPRCYPPGSDRARWARLLDSPVRRAWAEEYLRAARQLKDRRGGEPLFPQLSAADALAFIRNGNRVDYEAGYFLRRSRLSLFTMAEYISWSGEFLPEIIEGIWQLLGELYWALPAHCSYLPGDPMPRRDKPAADLFAAETGAILADLVNLLGGKLAEESPELVNWLRATVIERVIDPLKFEPWWFGGANNWTPWCSANVLDAAFTFLNGEPVRQAQIIEMLLGPNDRFIANYPEDGGCDEGPGYFQVSALCLMQFLDELNRRTDNAYLDVMRQPKLRNMGEYIVKAHLTGPWFLSPSDSTAKMTPNANAGLLARYAELSGSELLASYAREALYGFGPRREPLPCGAEKSPLKLNDAIRNFCWAPAGDARRKVRYPALGALPDLQLFVLREQPEDEFRGTILTLKGGHNAEGHNHIDVGQFELFRDGAPVIVDTGTMCYDRFTFNERRYERWCYNAEGHNLPQINGVVQLDGGEYKATVLAAEPGCVELELCDAYPAGSRIASLIRKAELCPDGAATITDTLRPAGIAGTVRLPLYSAVEPVKRPDGSCRLGSVELRTEGIAVESVEVIELTDSRLIHSWGSRLYKLVLTGKQPEWKLLFSPVRS